MPTEFKKSFTRENIAYVFAKSGMFYIHLKVISNKPRPFSYDKHKDMVAAEQIEEMVDEKRAIQKNDDGLHLFALCKIFVDTRYNVCLTSDAMFCTKEVARMVLLYI